MQEVSVSSVDVVRFACSADAAVLVVALLWLLARGGAGLTGRRVVLLLLLLFYFCLVAVHMGSVQDETGMIMLGSSKTRSCDKQQLSLSLLHDSGARLLDSIDSTNTCIIGKR